MILHSSERPKLSQLNLIAYESHSAVLSCCKVQSASTLRRLDRLKLPVSEVTAIKAITFLFTLSPST